MFFSVTAATGRFSANPVAVAALEILSFLITTKTEQRKLAEQKNAGQINNEKLGGKEDRRKKKGEQRQRNRSALKKKSKGNKE